MRILSAIALCVGVNVILFSMSIALAMGSGQACSSAGSIDTSNPNNYVLTCTGFYCPESDDYCAKSVSMINGIYTEKCLCKDLVTGSSVASYLNQDGSTNTCKGPILTHWTDGSGTYHASISCQPNGCAGQCTQVNPVGQPDIVKCACL